MSSIQTLTGFAHLTDLACFELTLGESRVVVSLYGAHVLSYEVAGKPILWLSPTANWHHKKAIRGGIPICWPWFGACPQVFHSLLTERPNHGFARTEIWQVKSQQSTVDKVTLLLGLETEQLAPQLDLGEILYQIDLTADALTVKLFSTQNSVQQAALHSYFCVADSQKATVSNLPTHFYDKTTDLESSDHSKACHFHAEIDRVYHAPEQQINLEAGAYTLNIWQEGQDSTVVWNPGEEKTRQSNDIPAAEWNKFACVESAHLALQPKQLCISQRIENPF